MDGHQVGLYMPEEMVEALDREAIRRDISRAALIREACLEKLAALAAPVPAKGPKKVKKKAKNKKK